MLFDSHCHAWRLWPYDTKVPDPAIRGSIENLLWEMDLNGVERAAIVCARIGGGQGGDGFANQDNNEYVARFAAQHSDRLTTWVDVDCAWRVEYHTKGAVERLKKEVNRASVTGFTHYTSAENDGWLLSDEGSEFFRVAAEHNLISSIATTADWFEDLASVAAANPTLPILIHHMSMPSSPNDLSLLTELAKQPNVGVKVSGFNYAAKNYWDYPYSESQILFQTVTKMFGARRIYWGSDYPASRDHLTFRQSIEVVRGHATFLDSKELDQLLGANLAQLVAAPRLLRKTSNDLVRPNPIRSTEI